MRKVLSGIYKDGKNYLVCRWFCFLGMQDRKQKNIDDAQLSGAAMDRVLERVQVRINRNIMRAI